MEEDTCSCRWSETVSELRLPTGLLFRAVFWVVLPCKMTTQKTALNIILAAVRTWNLTGLFFIPQMICEYGEFTVEWYWQGKIEIGEKPVPLILLPLQIPHGLTRAWTWASAVSGQPLTAWAMLRPKGHLKYLQFFYNPVKYNYQCNLGLSSVQNYDALRWTSPCRKSDLSFFWKITVWNSSRLRAGITSEIKKICVTLASHCSI
jgi:hypothetical protein